MSNPSFQKRQKERNRKDKQKDKEEKKVQRRINKPDTPNVEGVDPDIAGIVPGPQPLPEEFSE